MKPQDFMEALGGVSQEKLDALAKWRNAKTPITGEAPAKENRITQTADKPVFAVRRRETMKQNTKKKASAAQINPWKISVGATVAACAAIAVFIGAGIISLDKQMQVGSNMGTSVTEQISEREPIEITDYRIEGFDVVMGVPETGTAQLLHTVEDAQPWVELVRQNGEYGRSTGEGAEDFRALLENEEIYQDYDVIMTAVPYQFVYQDSGVAMYGFDGGTVTPGGSLTVEMRFLTVGNAMPERIFQQIDTFCCCFAVPKNTVPEITAFTFHDVIYDCTSPLPDGCDTREAHLDYLYSLPNYQEFMGKELTAKYLRFAKDDIQTAEESQSESIPPEGCTEVQETSADTAQSKQYVKLMQEYYTQKTGIPCDYDFSGMGKDLDETIETDDASIHIKGMVGCDWTMFVFFDVEPLNLSPENTEHFSSKSFSNLSDNMCLDCGILDANGNPIHSFNQTCRTMPAQQSLDNGIFHCYSIINNHSDEAVTGGEKYLGIGKRNGSGVPEYEISIPLDCLQSTPLQESSLAAIVSTFIPDNSEQCYYPQQMTRCAVTPFGVYSVSDQFKTVQPEWAVSCFWLEIPLFKLKATPLITQNDANGSVIRSFDLDGLTCWGSTVTNDTGISFADFLFDRPYETTKGMLTIQ